MKQLMWPIINFLQVMYFFFWSFLLQSFSILVRCFSGDQKLPLFLARKVWGPSMVAITNSKIVVEGAEKIDFSKPHIFVSTHQSTLDIAVAFSVLPIPLRFVAKKELSYIPFLGWYMWATGMIFIDRKNRERAIESLERAGRLIREGASIIAFPEGTRSPDGSVRPLKKGTFVVAIESGVPIVPIAIEGTRYVMPKDSFRIRPHEIRVALGSPIQAQDYSYEERQALMDLTYQELLKLNLSIGGIGSGVGAPSVREVPTSANTPQHEKADENNVKQPRLPSYSPSSVESSSTM